LIIGSSTGGPQALKEVVPYLPADIPAKMLLVQHMPEKFTEMFAQRLDKMSKINVKEAKDGDILTRGQALLAPGNYHMLVKEKGIIALNQEPHVLGVRPCVDLTLASSAQIYQKDVICVILTGMGHDGTQGAAVVKKYGGYCIAEHESTCVVYGMPKSVVVAGHADEVVPLHKIAESIIKAVYS
jgi:two-component system chemotaxis response regulator CheB